MALQWGEGTVLAVVIATHGPSYRDPGAAMAIRADGSIAGSITSGCIESDLILRAEHVRATGRSECLRYGAGSAFFDLKLPCGGGVDIWLFSSRDIPVLAELEQCRLERIRISLKISRDGRLSLGAWGPSELKEDLFNLGLRPAPRILIFGHGAEAATFAALAQSLAFEHLVLSHNLDDLALISAGGSPTQDIAQGMADLKVDEETAVALFYHDHDHEAEILLRMLSTSAFYIGAQGSRATQARRLAQLALLGAGQKDLDRVRGPIGIIPASRNPSALAISVIGEIIDVYGRAAP